MGTENQPERQVTVNGVLEAASAEFGTLQMRVVTLTAAINERDMHIVTLEEEIKTMRAAMTDHVREHSNEHAMDHTHALGNGDAPPPKKGRAVHA